MPKLVLDSLCEAAGWQLIGGSIRGRVSHPDFRLRVYKLFNKLLKEFILNVL